jgi:rSAM/selenodomain-associated transferase 2
VPDLVSIILPTYNEAASIGSLLQYLRATAGEPAPELLVVDGGSTDDTVAQARQAGATVLRSPRKGRAAQLNYGAQQAQGELLYFLHADSYPPPGFLADLRRAVAQGYGSGCYRLAFDHGHWFLRFSAWCTRFPFTFLRFGDQSLFVRRTLFVQLGGYREDLQVMEDQELVARLRARAPFRLLPRAVTTSARKYLANGVFRLQGIFMLIVLLYWAGVSQPRLVHLYRRLIRQGKL